MKPSIIRFKYLIKKTVSIFASREFAFIYCLLGTFGQIAHCYYLVESISSFDGWFRTLQAVLLSAFISSSLMYFVSIADNDNPDIKERKRIMRAVNMFMYIEILMNLYYYANHLLILSDRPQVFDFLFGSLVSMLIPVTIKLYANSIKAKEWIAELEGVKHITPENQIEPDAVQPEYNGVIEQSDTVDQSDAVEQSDVVINNTDEQIESDIKKQVDSVQPEHIDNVEQSDIIGQSDDSKPSDNKYAEIRKQIEAEIKNQVSQIDVKGVMGIDNIIIKSYVKGELIKIVDKLTNDVIEQSDATINNNISVTELVHNHIEILINHYLSENK